MGNGYSRQSIPWNSRVEMLLWQQIPCLICGNNAAYKKIKFAVDITRCIPPPSSSYHPPPRSSYEFEFDYGIAEVTIKLYDLFYGQPRTLLLLKGTPTSLVSSAHTHR